MSTSVVLLTNSISHEDTVKAFRNDSVIDYITKPLTIKKVIDVLRMVNI